MSALRQSVVDYCLELAGDANLVQGAGGNVSWKEGSTLWVKASGTQLGDAAVQEIFVPVDYRQLREALRVKCFGVVPLMQINTPLLPSIETLLHALLPQKIVVHLHAVVILAELVKASWEQIYARVRPILGESLSVNYFTPGAKLAQEIHNLLDAVRRHGVAKDQIGTNSGAVNLLFLRNHGVVLAGESVAEIKLRLNFLLDQFHRLNPPESDGGGKPLRNDLLCGAGYRWLDDREIQSLVFRDDLFARLESDWALFPDQVVFLGPRAQTYESIEQFRATIDSLSDHRFGNINLPPPLGDLIFIQQTGVYVGEAFRRPQIEQLRCYARVLLRQTPTEMLTTLSPEEITELLNWDAERYRQALAQNR